MKSSPKLDFLKSSQLNKNIWLNSCKTRNRIDNICDELSVDKMKLLKLNYFPLFSINTKWNWMCEIPKNWMLFDKIKKLLIARCLNQFWKQIGWRKETGRIGKRCKFKMWFWQMSNKFYKPRELDFYAYWFVDLEDSRSEILSNVFTLSILVNNN